MTIHDIKCCSEDYARIEDAHVGDSVRLREYNPDLSEYLGPETRAVIVGGATAYEPSDIRALLARLDSALGLLADMRAWLELRAAQTALTPMMDRLLTAICRELEG